MNCQTSTVCEWLTRFGPRVCERFFRTCKCKPIDEGSDDELVTVFTVSDEMERVPSREG